MARRQMDDARFNVAAGFMMLFPDTFKDSLLAHYDRSKTTIVWKEFYSALGLFYRDHYNFSRKGATQRNSVFFYCHRAKLLYKECEFDMFTKLPTPQRDTTFFNTDCPRNPRLRHKSHTFEPPRRMVNKDDIELYRALKFFIPAFIWGFCELKDALLTDYGVIEQTEGLIAAQDRLINGEPGAVRLALEKFVPARNRFDVGTAISVRSHPTWKAKKERLVTDWETGSARSTRRRNAQDGMSASPMSTPASTPVSTPIDGTRSTKEKGDPRLGALQVGTTLGTKRKMEDARKSLYAMLCYIALTSIAFNFPPDFSEDESSDKRPRADEEADVTATDGNEPNPDVIQNNAKKIKDALVAKLRLSKKYCRVHERRFNYVRKALHILLNDNLIELALVKESDPRRVTNSIVHDEQDKKRFFKETVLLLGEISKQTKIRLTEAEIEAYKRDAGILGDVMYDSDDYFSKGESITEEALDQHLTRWFENPVVKNDVDPASDSNNILCWLDNLRPVN